MNLVDLIDASFAERFTTTLLHFVWQGIAVGLVALAGQALLKRATARRRYALHVTALVVMAACVPVTFFLVEPPQVGDITGGGPLSDSVAERTSERALLPSEVAYSSKSIEATAAGGVRTEDSSLVDAPAVSYAGARGQAALLGGSVSADRSWLAEATRRSAPYVTLSYFLCCTCLLARLAHGVWGGKRLQRRATTVTDESLLEIVRQQASRLGLRLRPVVAWCAEVSVPVVVGVLKPMVLLPAVAATGMTPAQLQTLLTHELAHIRRYDLLVNLMQRIVESLLFFHPAVWYVSRRISSERELACDELVLASGCPRAIYADSLVRMAELACLHRGRNVATLAGVLAADGASPTEFKRRVLVVLGIEESRRLRPGRLALAIALSAVLLVVAAPVVWLHLRSTANAQTEVTSDQIESSSSDAADAAANADPASPNAAQDPLELPVSLAAMKMPLQTAVEQIASQAGLSVELDVEALKQVGFDLQQPVTLDFKDVTLSSALSRVIDWERHPGAMREVRGKRLVLTTLAAWQARTRERLPEWMKPLYGHGLLAALDEHDQVRRVTVGNIMTDELLGQIASLPQLRELEFELTAGLTPNGLGRLADMARLERLTVSVHSGAPLLGDDVIRSLVGLRFLRELALIECGVSDAGAKLLEQKPQLRSLSLRQEGRLTDEALKSIGKLTRLEWLSLNSYVGTQNLGWMRFSADGIRHLRGLNELRSLHLVGQEVAADALEFPKLTSLSLGHAAVTDAVAAKIGELTALQSLELTYCRIGDDGLKAIASLPELRRLDISSNTLTDAGIAHLAGSRQLTHVSLRASGLTDRSLEQLARIKTLTRLDLYGDGRPGVSAGRNYTAAGLARLREIPKLNTLWLTNFHLDGGYVVLRDLRQLRELTMTMCNITDAELEALDAALPDTRITHMTGARVWPRRPPVEVRRVDVSDELAKWRREAVAFMATEAGVRAGGERRIEVAVMPKGDVTAFADDRNRECRIQLSQDELAQFVRAIDQAGFFDQVVADGRFFFTPDGPARPADYWDRTYTWIHVRDGERVQSIACGYGWPAGEGNRVPGAMAFLDGQRELQSLIHRVRAGGRTEIARLVETANRGLSQAYPDLPPLDADNFVAAESFPSGLRVLTYAREDERGKVRVTIEQPDRGAPQPLTVHFNDERKDVERPPVVRELDLADYPVQRWTLSDVYEQRPQEPGESGTNRYYRPRDGFEEETAGVPSFTLWIHRGQNVFYVEHSDGVRRKVYGPISGDPATKLGPVP